VSEVRQRESRATHRLVGVRGHVEELLKTVPAKDGKQDRLCGGIRCQSAREAVLSEEFYPSLGWWEYRLERRVHMATYIVLGSFTDQGIRAVKDTTKRAEAIRGIGKKVGVTVKAVYWTLGQYDAVTIVEAPDDASVTAFSLSAGALGNARTQTVRAFSADEMGAILGRMA
jgi:uncharacterized protein with GYD domain